MQLSVAKMVLPGLLALAYMYAIQPPWFCTGLCCLSEAACVDVSVSGTVDPKYKPVTDALEKSLKKGWDIGASVFLRVDGKTVLDVAGGFKDKKKQIPYDRDTVNVIFSSGKIIETIGMALLADKGLVDIDKPIAIYWPEFGQNGKNEITIKDILAHRSGSMSLYENTPDVTVLQDPEARDNFLASQRFLYPRGTVGYRAWASAFYMDAVCRRVDPKQRSLSTFVREEIFESDHKFFCPPVTKDMEQHLSEVHDIPLTAKMLGLLPQLFAPTFYRKVLGEDHHIVLSTFEINLYKKLLLKNDKDYAGINPSIPSVDQGAASYNNRSSFLSYEMMSGNCISNARSLGSVFDAFMSSQIVSKEMLTKIMKPFPRAFDIFLQTNITHLAGGWGEDGLGLAFDNAQCFGWGGVGGSAQVHCSVGEHQFTFSYVMNTLSPRVVVDRAALLIEEVINILLTE